MKHNKAFTLVELVIVIAIIAIIGLIIAGGLAPKKAGAANDFSPIITKLRDYDIQYMYSSTGYLTIFNKEQLRWQDASEVCAALKPLDAKLKHVTLTPAGGTTSASELVWSNDNSELSNIHGRSEADCN